MASPTIYLPTAVPSLSTRLSNSKIVCPAIWLRRAFISCQSNISEVKSVYPILSATNCSTKLTNNGTTEREAMWIHFRFSGFFAIKIYAGGVNVVTGESAREDLTTKLRRMKLLL